MSNVASKFTTRKSTYNTKSGETISSAQNRAEAEKASLLAHAATLHKRHALEAQEEQLGRKREQLELDAELAASTAKLAVLQAASD